MEIKNKYFDWLTGITKHFPKLNLPEVRIPRTFNNLEAPKKFPNQEQLNSWYNHKSNKERWIEEQELRDQEIEHDSIMDAMECSK